MDFIGGPGCSGAANPLTRFTKHVHDDQTLLRDRPATADTADLALNAFRNVGPGAGRDNIIDTFLVQPPSLRQELALSAATGVHLTPPGAALIHSTAPTPWAQAFHLNKASSLLNATDPWSAIPMSIPMSISTPMPMVRAQATAATLFDTAGPALALQPAVPWTPSHQWPRTAFPPAPRLYTNVFAAGQLLTANKGKGRVEELDDGSWEDHFAQMELEDQQVQERQPQDESGENAATMRSQSDPPLDAQLQSETDSFGDFEALWKSLQAQTADEQQHWPTSYGDGVADEIGFWSGEFSDFGPSAQDRWDQALPSVGTEPYLFESENLYESRPDAFDQGSRIMAEGGNLSLAALAFEAAVQQDPTRVEAWVALGASQAQNEKDTAAIRALQHALRLDPDHLAALMGLAVAYTNEGATTRSYRTLERWLAVRYPQLFPGDAPPADQFDNIEQSYGFGATTDPLAVRDRVTELFIQAAQLRPSGADMDPDVQVGLGVLLFGADEFDKAVDCFTAALRSAESGASNSRDQAHLLWNRLGATLANGGRPEAAVAAYERALALRPNFVRARYNLAVTCISVACLPEAVAHLLAALAMHQEIAKAGRARARELLATAAAIHPDQDPDDHLDRLVAQNISTTIYDTLRRVFLLMTRSDLVDKTAAGVDLDVFRPEFDF